MNEEINSTCNSESASSGLLCGFLRGLFMYSGVKLYMDWILITNPTSHNPVIRHIYGWAKEGCSAYRYKQRYILARGCLCIHGVFAIIGFFAGQPIVINMLLNIYPCLVQLWIGYRIYKIIQFKKERIAV